MALELLGVDVESPKIKQLMEECTDGGQVNFVRFLIGDPFVVVRELAVRARGAVSSRPRPSEDEREQVG